MNDLLQQTYYKGRRRINMKNFNDIKSKINIAYDNCGNIDDICLDDFSISATSSSIDYLKDIEFIDGNCCWIKIDDEIFIEYLSEIKQYVYNILMGNYYIPFPQHFNDSHRIRDIIRKDCVSKYKKKYVKFLMEKEEGFSSEEEAIKYLQDEGIDDMREITEDDIDKWLFANKEEKLGM